MKGTPRHTLIVITAIASLTAGAAYAQYNASPSASSPSATAPAAGAEHATTSDTGAAITETQAKTKIEDQGFTNVSELKKDSKGMWMAKAMKNGKSVQLSMDTSGKITQLN
jgi:hypothetical protein